MLDGCRCCCDGRWFTRSIDPCIVPCRKMKFACCNRRRERVRLRSEEIRHDGGEDDVEKDVVCKQADNTTVRQTTELFLRTTVHLRLTSQFATVTAPVTS